MSLIREPELPQLKTIIGEKKKKKVQKPVLPARCENCGGNYFVREGPATKAYEKGESHGFCSNECRTSWLANQAIYSDSDDDDLNDAEPISIASYGAKQGGMRGGATEITDNTLEKKLIDATAPYNEKAARNAENFAKASIEVGKAILDQLELDPLAFINKAKALGIKITEITKEGIFLLFPGDASMGESVDKLIKSGTKLYFLPVRILGTIAITIFLSMFDVFIPLKFLEKIPGLKPFIDLIMKYTAIIPSILKNLKIPNLSFGSLIDSDVMDASYLRNKYEYKRSGSEGGGKKKRKTRRKKRRKN
ncbi:MAG: hypothetical protein L7S72_01245 [Flavobacteriales bacterium]|nr:hypothetical protein [Flavobacteriales bacterium]